MAAQTPRGIRQPVFSLTTIASMLAPTGPAGRTREWPSAAEHARDGGTNTAGNHTTSVFVDDHREHARSYRTRRPNAGMAQRSASVGAGMLAMAAQTPRGIRQPVFSLTTIASMLAPTGPAGQTQEWPSAAEHARDDGTNTAGNQTASVFVDDHREHARSYRTRRPNAGMAQRSRACSRWRHKHRGESDNQCFR